MRLTEIAKKNGIDEASLENYLMSTEVVPFQSGIYTGVTVATNDVPTLLNNYKQYLEDSQPKESPEAQRAAEEKRRAISSMLITSGFNFDGYTIKKYSGYISGDDAVQVSRGESSWWSTEGATDVGAALMESLVKIRRTALAELKEAAYALGCNAVIGVDFDYLTLDPEVSNGAWSAQNQRTIYLPYVFGVTANGNAVIIEKNEIK